MICARYLNNLTNPFQRKTPQLTYARVSKTVSRERDHVFLRAIIYNHVAGKEPKYSWVWWYKRSQMVHICWSLTNAHVLLRGNYRIKLSLLIPNAVLIAMLDNLLNCSIMKPVIPTLSPFSTSLEALRIHTRFPRFRRLQGKSCGHFVHIVYGNRSRTLQQCASFRIF